MAARRQVWDAIVAAHFKRGMKSRCIQCGDRYQVESLYICSSCGVDYCYRCVWKLAPSHSEWACPCGGETKGISTDEWLRGYETWKKAHPVLRVGKNRT